VHPGLRHRVKGVVAGRHCCSGSEGCRGFSAASSRRSCRICAVLGFLLCAGIQSSAPSGRRFFGVEETAAGGHRFRAWNSLPSVGNWGGWKWCRPGARLWLWSLPAGEHSAGAVRPRGGHAKLRPLLLDIWKNADADFIPAPEARRELAALSAQPKDSPALERLYAEPRDPL
jgi:hypothetical protein